MQKYVDKARSQTGLKLSVQLYIEQNGLLLHIECCFPTSFHLRWQGQS